MNISLDRAKWHIQEGESDMDSANREKISAERQGVWLASAAAHFAASMAITNVLLAEQDSAGQSEW